MHGECSPMHFNVSKCVAIKNGSTQFSLSPLFPNRVTNGLLPAELKCRENTVTAQFIVCNSVSFLIIEVKLFQAFLIFMCYLTAGYLVQV